MHILNNTYCRRETLVTILSPPPEQVGNIEPSTRELEWSASQPVERCLNSTLLHLFLRKKQMLTYFFCAQRERRGKGKCISNLSAILMTNGVHCPWTDILLNNVSYAWKVSPSFFCLGLRVLFLFFSQGKCEHWAVFSFLLEEVRQQNLTPDLMPFCQHLCNLEMKENILEVIFPKKSKTHNKAEGLVKQQVCLETSF